MFAVFGGGERSGRWRVRRRTNAIAIFGGHDLDMTNAVFEGREVTVWAFAVFGGIDITVPDAVTVRSEGVGIFGADTAAGSRLDRMGRFFARLSEQMSGSTSPTPWWTTR